MYIYNSISLFLFVLLTTISITSASGSEPMDRDLILDVNKIIKQSNACKEMTNCLNELSIHDFATSKGNTLSKSAQNITQINECSQDQICVNIADLKNDVFGSGTSINSVVTQDVYQYCGPTSGTTCLNSNDVFIDASK